METRAERDDELKIAITQQASPIIDQTRHIHVHRSSNARNLPVE